jgi:Heterokaryon incompatibility protein Het-C
LEIDPRSGMKNYIANGTLISNIKFNFDFLLLLCTEQGHWDTSKALVRRTLERCIQIGRRNRVSGDKHDEYEAFRLLGQAVRYPFFPLISSC